jgi:hypothetical protein
MTQPMSPFQIRLELLKMAKELLMEEYFAKRDQSINTWNIQVEEAKVNGTPSPAHPEAPQIPDEVEIIKRATALNGFVSQITVDTKTKK